MLNAKGARIATIALGGGAGNVQYDAGSRHILVDVQTRDEVAVIDPRTNKLIRRVPVHCQSDHSLYVDSSRRLAFVACDGDAKLLTLDLRTMKVTQTADVGSDPDVLAFDTGNRRLYVAAESGDVAVFAEHAHTLDQARSVTPRLGRAHRCGRPAQPPRLLPARSRQQRPASTSDHEARVAGQYANTAATTLPDFGGVATTDTLQSVAPANTGG